MLTVEINDRQEIIKLDLQQMEAVVRRVLESEGITRAQVGIAIVDNAEIQQLNRHYLGHDHPTDVLSFLLHADEEKLEADVVVSAETAAETATRFGWTPANEALLYAVHGVLHVVGYDDSSDEQRSEMRAREEFYLAQEDLILSYEER